MLCSSAGPVCNSLVVQVLWTTLLTSGSCFDPAKGAMMRGLRWLSCLENRTLADARTLRVGADAKRCILKALGWSSTEKSTRGQSCRMTRIWPPPAKQIRQGIKRRPIRPTICQPISALGKLGTMFRDVAPEAYCCSENLVGVSLQRGPSL